MKVMFALFSRVTSCVLRHLALYVTLFGEIEEKTLIRKL